METWKTLRRLSSLLAFFLALIGTFSAGAKEVFGGILAAAALYCLIQGGERGLIALLHLTVMTLVVGQRTIYLGAHFRVVPSEIFLWLLAGLCLLRKPAEAQRGMPMPLGVIVLSLGALLGVHTNLAFIGDMDVAVAYSKGLLLAVPTFVVAYRLLRDFKHVRAIAMVLAMESLFLSLLSAAEYFELPLIRPLAGFYSGEGAVHENAIFERGMSSFWGNPMLTAFLALCFPLIMAEWRHSSSPEKRVILGLSLAASAFAIYIGGHRGVWLPWAVAVSYWLSFRSLRGKLLCGVLVAAAAFWTPEAARQRLAAGLGQDWQSSAAAHMLRIGGEHGDAALQSISGLDSSVVERLVRLQYAIYLIRQGPFLGNGWGASGLVHNDWIQIWADAGLVTLLALLAVFWRVQRRLSEAVPKLKERAQLDVARAFKASLLGYALIMATNPLFNLPEQYPAMWIIMAMGYHFPRLAAPSEGAAPAGAGGVRAKTGR